MSDKWNGLVSASPGFDIPEQLSPNIKRKIIFEEDFKPAYPPLKYGINRTRTATFFSIRRFTAKDKKNQLKTILRYKDVFNQDFIDMVAGDFYVFISSVFGNIIGFNVTSLPPGNSIGHDFHLATEIAKSLSAKLGIKYVEMFKPYLKKNHNVGNHTNKQRLIAGDTGSPPKLILVDDVATTGTSIESAMNRLKKHNSFLIPVVWVYSEVKIG